MMTEGAEVVSEAVSHRVQGLCWHHRALCQQSGSMTW